MSDDIRFSSRVGDDGVLSVQISLGHSKANKEVLVTIEPTEKQEPNSAQRQLSWPEFLQTTYGSCADLGLERGEQGDFEQREPIV